MGHLSGTCLGLSRLSTTTAITTPQLVLCLGRDEAQTVSCSALRGLGNALNSFFRDKSPNSLAALVLLARPAPGLQDESGARGASGFPLRCQQTTFAPISLLSPSKRTRASRSGSRKRTFRFQGTAGAVRWSKQRFVARPTEARRAADYALPRRGGSHLRARLDRQRFDAQDD